MLLSWCLGGVFDEAKGMKLVLVHPTKVGKHFAHTFANATGNQIENYYDEAMLSVENGKI